MKTVKQLIKGLTITAMLGTGVWYILTIFYCAFIDECINAGAGVRPLSRLAVLIMGVVASIWVLRWAFSEKSQVR